MSKKDPIINFYTLKEVQEYLPKFKDPQVKYTGMPLQKHILLVGGTGAGKSNSMMNYILRTGRESKPAFDHLMIVYKTDEALNLFLKEKLKDNMTSYYGLDKLPPCSAFPDSGAKNAKQILLVFDDCVNDIRPAQLQKIKDYYAFGKKKGFTIIFLTQSYYSTAKFFRQQSSYIILNSIRGEKDLAMILRDTGAGAYDINTATLRAMYEYCKTKDNDDDLPFMKICIAECPIEKKFSKNFLEYLDPEEFFVSDKKKGKRQSSYNSDDSD